jgi:hypothetical protein
MYPLSETLLKKKISKRSIYREPHNRKTGAAILHVALVDVLLCYFILSCGIIYQMILGGLKHMISRPSIRIVFVIMFVLSFAVFTGCTKPPAEEMAKAEKALEEAKQKEAPVYVPDLFKKAEDSLKKAKDYIAAKKYKEAKPVAIETETLSRQAIAGIEAAKIKIKTEAEQIAQDVQKSIDDLKAMAASTEKNKKLAAAREEVQGTITKWEADLAAVKEKLQSKTKEAGDALKAMKEEVDKKKEEATSLLTAPPAPQTTPSKKKK